VCTDALRDIMDAKRYTRVQGIVKEQRLHNTGQRTCNYKWPGVIIVLTESQWN
jgi:hypothetical protein